MNIESLEVETNMVAKRSRPEPMRTVETIILDAADSVSVSESDRIEALDKELEIFEDNENEFIELMTSLMKVSLILRQTRKVRFCDSMYQAIREEMYRVVGIKHTIRQLRETTAIYLMLHKSRHHIYSRYTGVDSGSILRYCNEIRGNKSGNIEVDLDNLFRALKVNIVCYEPALNVDGYVKHTFENYYPHQLRIAYLPLAQRFICVEEMAVVEDELIVESDLDL